MCTLIIFVAAAPVSCYAYGNDICNAPERLTHCVDVEYGYLCSGCLQGATPKTHHIGTNHSKTVCEGYSIPLFWVVSFSANEVADIDECELGYCGRQHVCDNTVFPYRCECQSGFRHDSSVYGNNCTGYY